jgi:RimJ/RimL family protein N-acetyltransferase
MKLGNDKLMLIPFEPQHHGARVYAWFHSGDYQSFFGNRESVKTTDSAFINPSFMIVGANNASEIYGMCSLMNADDRNRNLIYGILVDKKYQRTKIATEMSKLMLYYIMNEMNMYKVVVRVTENLFKWIAAVKDFGFTQEGCLRKHIYRDGEFHDLLIFSILKGEFNKRYKKEIDDHFSGLESGA